MNPRLLSKVLIEKKRGKRNWGHIDRTPDILLNAALEELGEVAHAINHNESKESIEQEIAELIGVLIRMDEMVMGE